MSDLGRIKILARLSGRANFKKIICKEKIKKSRIDNYGYVVTDFYKNSTPSTKKISIVVAESFMGHVSNGHKIVVDHIKNEERTNNTIFNLQLITNRQNTSKDKKTKNTGISFNPKYLHRKNPYEVKIRIGKDKVSIGCFETIEKANEYYKLAVINVEFFNGNHSAFRELLNRPDKGSKLDRFKVKLIRRYFTIYPNCNREKLCKKFDITIVHLRAILRNQKWHDENYSTAIYLKHKNKGNYKQPQN